MQTDTAAYSQTQSQVNIAVNVPLRNVTRIAETAQTVEAAGLQAKLTASGGFFFTQQLFTSHKTQPGRDCIVLV